MTGNQTRTVMTALKNHDRKNRAQKISTDTFPKHGQSEGTSIVKNEEFPAILEGRIQQLKASNRWAQKLSELIVYYKKEHNYFASGDQTLNKWVNRQRKNYLSYKAKAIGGMQNQN